MPVFEFACNHCRRRFSTLVGMVAGDEAVRCPQCGSDDCHKLVSRFTRGRSEDDRLGEMADRLEQMGEPESRSEMRELVREMGKATDDDLSDDMEEWAEMDFEEEAS